VNLKSDVEIKTKLKAKVDDSEARVDDSEARVDDSEARVDDNEARVDDSEAKVDGSEAKKDAKSKYIKPTAAELKFVKDNFKTYIARIQYYNLPKLVLKTK
jgi:hypothetical protein